MTPEELAGWMKLVSTHMLELILLVRPEEPQWFTAAMTEEVKKRREAKP